MLVAFTVVAGTLFVQGLSLPWLARRLRVPGPDPLEDALAGAAVLQQASKGGLALEELRSDDDDPERRRARCAAAASSSATSGVGAARRTERRRRRPSELYRRVRLEMMRGRARAGAATSAIRDRRQRGGQRGAVDARRRGVDARRSGQGGAAWSASCVGPRSTGSRRCEHLRAAHRVGAPEHPGRLRGVPARRDRLGAPPAVPDLRPRRLLRLLAAPPRRPRTSTRPSTR